MQKIQKLKIFPILSGFRGQAGIDSDATENMIIALSELFAANPEITEIDINPILFKNNKPLIVNAKLYK